MKSSIENRRWRVSGMLLAAGVLLAAGCSLPLPQAQADLTRYFLLQEGIKPGENAGTAPSCVIRVERVEVPAYLLDKPLVVRRGPNEVRYLETARWAEPLDQNLARNVMQGLEASPGIAAISHGSRIDKCDYNLRIQITACEGAEGRSVLFAANWTLLPAPGSSRPGASGVFSAHDLTWDGSSAASLTAALSEGVTQLCQTLAAAAKAQP
jgi:uncharacterized lipoprotein YmbA